MSKQTFKIPNGCTGISIEQVGNQIVTTFEPCVMKLKAGDVIHWGGANSGLGIVLGRCDVLPEDNYSVFMLDGINGKNRSLNYEYVRLALIEECSRFYAAIALAGKVWNAEKLCIEDLKPLPVVGDCVRATYENGNRVFSIISTVGFCKYVSKCAICEFDKSIVDRSIEISSYETIEVITKDVFISELADIGFQYDFKTDKFSKLEWKPKVGEIVFAIDYNDKKSFHMMKMKFDSGLALEFSNGIIKRTESECQSAIDKIKAILYEGAS